MSDKKKAITTGLKNLTHKASVRIAPALKSSNAQLKDIVGRAKSLRRRGEGYTVEEDEPPYEYDPGRFTPSLPLEMWEKIFRFLDVADLYALSHVNKLFRAFSQNRPLFQQTIQAYAYDDVNPFPPTDQIPLEMHGPLAMALHNREMSWRSGKVNSITVLTGHNSNNIGLMSLAGPWFVATFTDEDTLRIWDMRTLGGRGRVLTVLHGLQFSFMKIVLETEELVAAIKHQHVIKVYDLKTGYVRKTLVAEMDEGPITALAAVGEAAVAGFNSGKVILWDNMGKMEYQPDQQSKIIALEIYGPYVLSITASGFLNTHTTNEPNLPMIRRLRLPTFTTSLHVAQYARFATTGPLSVLIATFERPDHLDDTIFNFHQDIRYDLYHVTWDGEDQDSPLHRPKIRYWPSEMPGHNVRWEEFDHVSKGRAVVAELDTNTMSPHIRIVWPREHKIVDRFWSDNSRYMALIEGMGKRDGWVPQFGIDDERIILTGRWQEFYVLDFSSPALHRIRTALENGGA